MTTSPLSNTTAGSSALQVAQAAFEAFKHGVETGDGQPFADLMHENVVFRTTVPQEAWRGEQHGRSRVGEMIPFEYNELKLRATITQTGVPAAAGNTFAFEFRVQGTVNGAPYANWNAMFFEVEGDKIRRWREYIGDLDLETIKAIQPR